MKKLLLSVLCLVGCGINADVKPVITLVPKGVITLESAGCVCSALPADIDFVLVPVEDYEDTRGETQ